MRLPRWTAVVGLAASLLTVSCAASPATSSSSSPNASGSSQTASESLGISSIEGVSVEIGSCAWSQNANGEWVAVAHHVRLSNSSQSSRSFVLRIDFQDSDGLGVGSMGFGDLPVLAGNQHLDIGDASGDYSMAAKRQGAVTCIPVLTGK